MTTLCSQYDDSSITNVIRTSFFEDDFFTGTTFFKHAKVRSYKNPSGFVGRITYGSGQVIIDLGTLYNYFMHVPIHTRFKLKDDTNTRPFRCIPAIVAEPEEKEFTFEPIPVRRYELKVQISSVKKGKPKFHLFNDIL